jgi:two-component system chemotaxis response regulator CheY
LSESLYSPQSLTVLIVDDHDPIRKAIKRVLAGMGFGEILESFSGPDALKLLTKRPVDLLITDLYMRGPTGFELLEHVRNRELGCDVPIIVVTGEASKEEIVKVADMGADDYVLKPFQAQDLEKKVIKTLNQYYSPTPLLKALRKSERLFLAGDFKKALEAYEEALRLDGESTRAHHGKALTLERLGRPDDAIALLNSNIARNHSFHRNYGALADILIKKNRIRDAIDAMRRELEINPKQPSRQVQLAKLLLKEGDALGAVEHYRVALQEDPRRLGALMGMGHAYSLANNIDKALYYFKRVRRYHPGATKALESAVRCAISAGEPKKAEMFLRDEKATHPDRSDAYELLAAFYVNQDRDDAALATLDELIAKEPQNAAALLLKARIYTKQKNHPAALLALEEMAKVAPSGEGLTFLAEAYMRASRANEAADTLQRAITLSPDSAYAFHLLADIHRGLQQWIKAYMLYRRAAQLGANKDVCHSEAKECLAQANGRRQKPRAAS